MFKWWVSFLFQKEFNIQSVQVLSIYFGRPCKYNLILVFSFSYLFSLYSPFTWKGKIIFRPFCRPFVLLIAVTLCTFSLPSGTCKDIPQNIDSIIEELQKRLAQQERKLEQQERQLENVAKESVVTKELFEKAVISVSILKWCKKTCSTQKLSWDFYIELLEEVGRVHSRSPQNNSTLIMRQSFDSLKLLRILANFISHGNVDKWWLFL